jgi:hypothetical protein
MGPTAFLPLRRKSCFGFLSSWTSHRPRLNLNPRTLGPVTGTLPLDHRGRLTPTLHDTATWLRKVSETTAQCTKSLNVIKPNGIKTTVICEKLQIMCVKIASWKPENAVLSLLGTGRMDICVEFLHVTEYSSCNCRMLSLREVPTTRKCS